MSSEAQRIILTPVVSDSSHLGELRLLLEELCCDLSRFEHVRRDASHQSMYRSIAKWRWDGKEFLRISGRPRGGGTYFVEVKYGCPDDAILRSLARKYAEPDEVVCHASRVVLVVDRIGRVDWEGLVRAARAAVLGAGVKLDV